ncbi:hypothetical protein SprV_0200830400 [Sparganum proliferum]
MRNRNQQHILLAQLLRIIVYLILRQALSKSISLTFASRGVQSTDSGFDSEHAFAWWSSASQTASEQSDLRGCGAGADDPLSSLEFGSSVNRAGSCSTDGSGGGGGGGSGGLPFPPAAVPSSSSASASFNGFQNQEDQQLMQEVKAVVAAAAAAAAATATFKSPLDVPPPTSTALRCALWASWPLSPTGELLACRPTPAAMDFPTGGVSSSVSGCCRLDPTQRQQGGFLEPLFSPPSLSAGSGSRHSTTSLFLPPPPSVFFLYILTDENALSCPARTTDTCGSNVNY